MIVTTKSLHQVVVLQMPAALPFVRTARLTSAAAAAVAGMSIDDVEDLVLAVDEACALLMPLADEGAAFELRYELTARSLTVRTSVRGAGEPDRRELGWTVLDALASTLSSSQEAGRVTIVFSKQSGTGDGDALPG